MRFIIRTLITMAGVWLADTLLPRMHLANESLLTLALVAIVIGLVNAVVRPIITILTLPLTIVTLGLFLFVINALMLLIVGMLPWLDFQGSFIQMFVTALIGSFIISAVSIVANMLLSDLD